MLEHPRSSPPIASCPTCSRTEEHGCWLGHGTPPQSGRIHPVMRVQHTWHLTTLLDAANLLIIGHLQFFSHSVWEMQLLKTLTWQIFTWVYCCTLKFKLHTKQKQRSRFSVWHFPAAQRHWQLFKEMPQQSFLQSYLSLIPEVLSTEFVISSTVIDRFTYLVA